MRFLKYMAFTILLVFTTALPQSFTSGMMSDQQKAVKSGSARSARIDLENELRKEVKKRQEELQKLTQYIPIEGSVDEKNYIIGPGDQFGISISGAQDERYILQVGADGVLLLPYVSGVKVAGSSLEDAKKAISAKLESVFKGSILTVSLVGARLFVIHVTGQVALPGSYTVTSSDRVYSSIETAGGYSPSANISRVMILRGSDTIRVDLSRYIYFGDISQNPFVLDGDVIFVPGPEPSLPSVFVFGGGNIYGTVNIRDGEGVEDLLAKIGANTEVVDLSNISLLRGGRTIHIDLFSDKEPPALSDGDSVFFKILPDSVYVSGRVIQGGAKQFISGADVHTYIAMAGGIAKEGSENSVKIIRNGKKYSVKEAGTIRRGDVVIVGMSTFYAITEVVKSFGEIASLITAVYVVGGFNR